jgi:hypothetical protein
VSLPSLLWFIVVDLQALTLEESQWCLLFGSLSTISVLEAYKAKTTTWNDLYILDLTKFPEESFKLRLISSEVKTLDI